MAPAAGPSGTPSPMAIPIKATPRVPMVPHEVPVASEVIVQTRHAVTRKNLGEISLSP
jgi:hypothetical protein